MWKSMAILENNVSISFCVTKLLLILWGEPHKDKNHWGGVTPRSDPGRERVPEVKKAQKGPLQTQGKKAAIDAGICELSRRKHPCGGTGSRHTGRGQEGWTRSHNLGSSLLFAFFCFCYMISESLCLSVKAGISALSLNPVTQLCRILLVGELYMATAAAQACLHCIPSFSTALQPVSFL